MKTRNKSFSALTIILCFSNLVSACKGETGPTVPQGLTGPQGRAGVANAIYSSWLNLKMKPVAS